MAGIIQDTDPRKLVRKWKRRLKAARNVFKTDLFEPGKKVVERYRDERKDTGGRTLRRYNLLASNVQTLQPAVYSKMPEVYVSRRYSDRDPLARIACQVLERATAFQLEPEQGGFHERMKQARDDYLLPGRGVLWVRYDATFNQIAPEAPPLEPSLETPLAGLGSNLSDGLVPPPSSNGSAAGVGPEQVDDAEETPQPYAEEVDKESAPLDYVFWRDFLHDPAPVWQDVGWVSRDTLKSRSEATKRFGKELADRLSYTHRRMEDPDKKTAKPNDDVDLAQITEIWDKEERCAIWISQDIDEAPLDHRTDPLRLNGFFPCPRPLYAALTNDSLVPRSDYSFYRDQAVQIDELTQRIWLLTKALAVRGAYDGSNPKIGELLHERPENFLVAVSNWAAFAEKGGLKGQLSFVPIDVIANVLNALIEKRGILIQDVFQITGISDIVRGQSDPNETLGAQEIKGSFATLRLDERKRAVAAFARDAIALVAEVVAEHFDPMTIRETSAFDEMAEVQQLEVTQPGAKEQLWQQVVALIKSDKLRRFKLDVETDSTTVMNKVEEQTRRTEFLAAVGAFLEKAIAALQVKPELGPLLGQMLLFGVRGFNVGRELEGAFEEAIQKMQAAGAQQQQPNPEQMKAQAAQASAQSKIQSMQQHDQMRAQEISGQQQLDQQQHQLDTAELAHNMQLDTQGADNEMKLGLMEMLLKHQREKNKPNGKAAH